MLVELVQHGNDIQKEIAATALLNLPRNVDNRLRIVAAKGITLFIRLVREGNPDQREEAAGVLAALATTRDTQAAIAAKAGIFDLLVELMQSGTSAQRNHALAALRALSGNDKCKEVVARGAIPVVGKLLKEGNKSQKELTSGILWNVSEIPDRVAIPDIAILVQLVQEGNSDVRVKAGDTLAKLATVCDNQAAIKAAGGISVLVQVLCGDVLPEKQHVLSALLHFSTRSDEVKAKMTAEGVIPESVRLLCSDDAMNQDAAVVLQNLSAYHDIFALKSRYGIPPLVALLRVGTFTQWGNALTALFNRAEIYYNRAMIVQAGAVPPLVKLMQDDFGVLQEQVVQVLALLSECAENVPDITAAGVIPKFRAILRTGNPIEKEYAAQALASLSLSDAHKRDIASADGIASLMVLKRVGDVNQKTYAAQVLSNLSTDAELRAVIEYANENALEELYDVHAVNGRDSTTAAELLLSMVREGDSLQQSEGLIMLVVWSASESNVDAIVAAGGISQAMKFIGHTKHVYREQALIVLKLLSRNSKCHKAIVAAGAIPVLISLVREGSIEETVLATVALANLASSSDMQEAIASAGGISLLLKLVNSGNDQQRESAALALANLAENNANRDAIASTGIPALLVMVKGGSVR